MIEELIKVPDRISLPHLEEWTAKGVRIYCLPAHEVEFCRLSIVINGGRHDEGQRYVSKMTALLLKEGLRKDRKDDKTALFEYYGASIKSLIDLDYVGVRITFLAKYFDQIVEATREMLEDPDFDEEDLTKLQRRANSNLRFDLSNKDTLSYRVFTEALFGEEHAYGYNSQESDIMAVTTHHLRQYYDKIWRQDRVLIFVTGPIDDIRKATLESIAYATGGATEKSMKHLYQPPLVTGPKYIQHHTGLQGSASMKVGKRSLTRVDQDYTLGYLANVMIGGFFGSVLNRRVREDKGLTYGIYSILEALRYDGIFMISTEIDPKNIHEVFDLVYSVLQELRTRELSVAALQSMKNYCIGYVFSLLDGPLNQIQAVESLVVDGASITYVEDLFQAILDVTSADLCRVVDEYFSPEEMTVTIVS